MGTQKPNQSSEDNEGATNMKRGTKVEFTYAAGKIVSGVIIKRHKGDFANWYAVKLTDDQGSYDGSCHRERLRNIDNRPTYQ